MASKHKMYAKPGCLLEALDKARKTDTTTTRKSGRLLETIDKVRKTDAVAEPTTRKPGRLAQALQKVKEVTVTEAVAGSPRGVKDFTRMKEAADETEVIATGSVVAKLSRVNKIPTLTADMVKPKSPVEVKTLTREKTPPMQKEEEK